MEHFIPIQSLLDITSKSFPRLYRSHMDRSRFYYTMINNQILRLPSVTTILAEVLPTEEWLIRWIASWGYERALEKRDEAAHYGTIFSICAADLLRHGSFDLSTIETALDIYRYSNNITFPTDHWVNKLKEDLFALTSFIQDYNFEPIAIELPLISTKYKFAGTLDALGYITIGNGQNGKILKSDIKKDKNGNIVENKTRRVLAIIDWKTGRKGFYRSHEAQLHMYYLLVQENFPEFQHQEIRLYNWAPKYWENPDDPKYHFKDQTNSTEKLKILHYLAIYHTEYQNWEPKIKQIDGILSLKKPNDNVCQVLEYRELIQRKLKNQPQTKETPKNETPENQPQTENDFLKQFDPMFNELQNDVLETL